MHIFALGASRATGYYAALGYLERGYTVTILLRSPLVLQQDPAFKQYLDKGTARLTKGDAMIEDEVVSAWKEAVNHAPVDVVLFSLGPTARFNLFKGFVIDKPNISSLSFLHTMHAVAQTSVALSAPPPRLAVVSAKSVTPGALALNPAPVRIIAGWLLRQLNLDKRGMEAIACHGLGKEYEKGMTPGEPILPTGWRDSLPAAGWAPRSVIIRPPQLTDGPAKGKYRADVKDFLVSKISRRDLGNFLAGDLLDRWEVYEGEIVTVGY